MDKILNDELKYRETQLAVMESAKTNFDIIFPFKRDEVLSATVMPSGYDRSVYITLNFNSMDALRAVRARLKPTKWEASTIGVRATGDSPPPAGWKRWRGEFTISDLRVVYDLDTTDLGTCKLVECGTSIVRNYKVVCNDQPATEQS